MAASFYKWLAFPVLALFLVSFSGRKAHPFHVSVTEVNHNVAEKTLEVYCKIFTDDFENALAKKFQAKIDLGKPEMHTAMDSLVKKYLASTIQFRAQGRVPAVQYLGFELDKEAAYCYFEVLNVTSLSRLEITNSILYDLFDDQMNIVHVFANGSRKSDKVSYPAKELQFEF
jgi:hypothetical protein